VYSVFTLKEYTDFFLPPVAATSLQPEQAHDEDVKLLKAIAAARDEAALGRLYDRYRVILFGVLLRILNNRAEAEDVLQEVFLQVWRRAADFDETRGRPFTWLVTLARSRGIDRLRTLASRERVAQAGAKEAPEEEFSDAATDAVKSEERGVVNKALDQLPEEQKRLLMLAYFDGLTQSEIATQLGAPLGTVKTRMRSGMIKLRELLSAKGEYFGY
jgi:RNA polymerase sigma-70 factor, ECF subfamily